MNVVIAKNGGFCRGVRRAVETAMKAGAGTYVLGELIHNRVVINELESNGIITVENLADVPDNATVIFRSHGVPKGYYSECERRGINILDCTCEFVRKTQRIVEEQHALGKTIVIAGEPTAFTEVKLSGSCASFAAATSVNLKPTYFLFSTVSVTRY